MNVSKLEPWEEYPEVWKTKAAFFNYLRGSLRKALWQFYPPKLIFKNESAYLPPPDYKGKAKRLGTCVLTGQEFPISKLEVDHIVGNVSLQDWEDVLPFILHLCASKDQMQLVSKEAHKIKSYAEKEGITFEMAKVEKAVIQWLKAPISSQDAFIAAALYSPMPTNAKGRREAIRTILIQQQTIEQS